MSGDETCKENWYFSNANDLHTSANIDGKNNLISAGTRMYNGVYNATNNIIAENNVTIIAGTSVTFEAGRSITLNPGFKVEKGTSFTARIQNCERGCDNLKSASNSGYIADQTVIKNLSDNNQVEGYKSNLLTNKVSIFPNPSNSKISISCLNDNKINNIQIIDVFGKVVYYKYKVHSQETSVNISKLTNGIYLITISMEEGNIYSEKLIKN
jgi:hypothetical protein